MGALHEGHLALVAEARSLSNSVAASIFVNPMQFGAGEDFGRYPRQLEEDARMLEEAGCNLVWAPSIDDVYPEGFSTRVRVEGVSERWEGEARPGHFDGVATVVAKLLGSVRPDFALFGEKDFQQLAVIRRMVADLNIQTKVIGAPTVREPNGLALSSRNSYLSPSERQEAVALPQSLDKARNAIRNGAPVAEILKEAREFLLSHGFTQVDYFALVDARTLLPLEAPNGEMRLIAAAVIGRTRLIDNLPV